MQQVIVLPDIHWERHNKRALSSTFNFIAARAPDLVVQLGDLYTFDEFSRWRKDPRRSSDTLETVGTAEEKFWKPLRALLPMESKIWFTLGNHEQRIYDYLIDKAPQVLALYKDPEVPYEDWLGFGPYVDKWVHYRQGLLLGNTLFTHGDRTGMASARSLLADWGSSGVSGHTHRSERSEKRTFSTRMVWQEAGFLGDVNQWYNSPQTANWHTGFVVAWVDEKGKVMPQISFVPVDEKSGKFWYEGKLWTT